MKENVSSLREESCKEQSAESSGLKFETLDQKREKKSGGADEAQILKAVAEFNIPLS